MANQTTAFQQNIKNIVEKFIEDHKRLPVFNYKSMEISLFSESLCSNLSLCIDRSDDEKSLADMLSHCLNTTWNHIKSDSRAYTSSPYSLPTTTVLAIAQLLHQFDPSKTVYQYMMPSLECIEDSIGIEDMGAEGEENISTVDDWQLSRVILSQDKRSLIPVCIMNYVSNDTPLSALCLPYRLPGSTENTPRLSLDEQQRLQAHSMESKVYFSLLKDLQVSDSEQASAGGALKALIANLKQAGAKKQGTEGKAGESAYLGVQQFCFFMESLSDEEREPLLNAVQDKSQLRSALNKSLRDVIEILVHQRVAIVDENGNDKTQDGVVMFDNNPMTCVEVNADILSEILAQNREIFSDQRICDKHSMLDLAFEQLKRLNVGTDQQPKQWDYCVALAKLIVAKIKDSDLQQSNILGLFKLIASKFKDIDLFDDDIADDMMSVAVKHLLTFENMIEEHHFWYYQDVSEGWGISGPKSILGVLSDSTKGYWSQTLRLEIISAIIGSRKCTVEHLCHESVDLYSILNLMLHSAAEQKEQLYEKLLAACERSQGFSPCLFAFREGNLLIAAFKANKMVLAEKLIRSELSKRSQMMTASSFLEGKTPLMYAVEAGDLDVVKAMLDHPKCSCAMLTQTTLDGKSAADFTQDLGLKDMLQEAVDRKKIEQNIYRSRRGGVVNFSFLGKRSSFDDNDKDDDSSPLKQFCTGGGGSPA